ncbi:MAG: hypothetical protein DRG87_01945 [Deltaproteobacteria bacterium]|nr:MAG: hypothetical protein DRG87_01945 [Deltaproteobacteria bacterium]
MIIDTGLALIVLYVLAIFAYVQVGVGRQKMLGANSPNAMACVMRALDFSDTPLSRERLMVGHSSSR